MPKKRYGLFSNRQIKNRLKRHAPVWLWKWTADAYHKYKERRKKFARSGK